MLYLIWSLQLRFQPFYNIVRIYMCDMSSFKMQDANMRELISTVRVATKKLVFVWKDVLCKTQNLGVSDSLLLSIIIFSSLEVSNWLATKWIVFSCIAHWQMMQKRQQNLNEFLHWDGLHSQLCNVFNLFLLTSQLHCMLLAHFHFFCVEIYENCITFSWTTSILLRKFES